MGGFYSIYIITQVKKKTDGALHNTYYNSKFIYRTCKKSYKPINKIPQSNRQMCKTYIRHFT